MKTAETLQQQKTALAAELTELKEKVFKQDGNPRSNAKPQDLDRVDVIEKELAGIEIQLTATQSSAENTLPTIRDNLEAAKANRIETEKGGQENGTDNESTDADETAEPMAEEPARKSPTVSELADAVAILAQELETVRTLLHRANILPRRKFSNMLKKLKK